MFSQDGARAHTSKATIAWLNANIKFYIPPEDSLTALFSRYVSFRTFRAIVATAVYANQKFSHRKH